MKILYILLFIVMTLCLLAMILFFRRESKNKFVTYDEAIKRIIEEASETNIVINAMSYSEEKKLSYWRYIIHRHFFSGINDDEYKFCKIKRFNEKTYGKISIKNLNKFIKSIKKEQKAHALTLFNDFL